MNTPRSCFVSTAYHIVEASLGAEIQVPRPEGGTVWLRLPGGSLDGKLL